VVSYIAIVDVQNSDERLRPGMTADVSLPGLRRDEAVRIPNNALTFRPTPEMLAALGQSRLTGHETGGTGQDRTARSVWEFDGKHFTPITVHAGLTDDSWSELLSGSIRPGDELVTKAELRRSRL
jgi:HlyD family secretion protein